MMKTGDLVHYTNWPNDLGIIVDVLTPNAKGSGVPIELSKIRYDVFWLDTNSVCKRYRDEELILVSRSETT